MKFPVSLVLGCLYVGFLNLAASDLQHAREHEIIASGNITEELKDSDRSAALSVASASVNGLGLPGKKPVELILCYDCADCPTINDSTFQKLCPYSLDPTKKGLCVTYVEQYKNLKKPWYIRGCASERGSCADIIRSHSAHSDIVQLLSCSECGTDDLCNGASHSMADFTMAFLVLMVSPLIAKFTLS